MLVTADRDRIAHVVVTGRAQDREIAAVRKLVRVERARDRDDVLVDETALA